MSSDAKIPEWAMEAAFEAQTAAIEECKAQRLGANYDYPFVTCRSKEVLDRHIALALLAAEQRGRKAGIERVLPTLERLRHWIEDEVGAELPFTEAEQAEFAAIRSLGEKP